MKRLLLLLLLLLIVHVSGIKSPSLNWLWKRKAIKIKDVDEKVPDLELDDRINNKMVNEIPYRSVKKGKSEVLSLVGKLGLFYLLISEAWKQVREALEELEQQQGGVFLEDHDQLFFSPEILSSLNTTKSIKKNSRRSHHQKTAVSCLNELIERLSAVGLKRESCIKVLSRLTKKEGHILSSCLLVPDGKTSWRDIAGLQYQKESLKDLFSIFFNPSYQLDYGPLFSTVPAGILLYGPPGCGKSLLARALAQSTEVRFLSLSPSSLLRKYVGETNLHVRALFSLAKKIQPCVIFVDEIDGLFRERSMEEHDVSRDLKVEFLSLWDGIRQNHRILIIGATNRPFDVDPAFLRRLSRSFFVGLPDKLARIQQLQTLLNNVPIESTFNFPDIAQLLEGYSPSDIHHLLQTAALLPLKEASNNKSKLRKLATNDILFAKQQILPTQWSSSYRNALAQYVHRANHHLTPYNVNTSCAINSFYFIPHQSQEENYYNCDDEYDDYSYSSSFEDDDFS